MSTADRPERTSQVPNEQPVSPSRQAAQEPQAPRRTRTSREEARENMLRAAIELLDERDPDQLTVREIAERSGHHHRFVQDWFGGKGGLMLEVMMILSADLAREIDLRPVRSEPDPRIVRVVKVLTWLVANSPDVVGGERMRPLVSRIENFFRDRFGVSADDARLLARHAVATIAGYVMFHDALGFDADDFPKVVALQFELGQIHGTRAGD